MIQGMVEMHFKPQNIEFVLFITVCLLISTLLKKLTMFTFCIYYVPDIINVALGILTLLLISQLPCGRGITRTLRIQLLVFVQICKEFRCYYTLLTIRKKLVNCRSIVLHIFSRKLWSQSTASLQTVDK